MNFRFSQDQELFRDTIRKFARNEIAPLVNEAEEKEEIPSGLFKKMGDMGFFSLRIPEEDGGLGKGKVEECILCEEVGYVNSGIAASVSGGMLTPYAIYLFGDEEQKMNYCYPGMKGEKVISLGISEPNAGSDVTSIQTTAKKEGDYWILNGSKLWITNGTFADFVLVVARVDKTERHDGLAVFIVDTKSGGFKAEKINKFSNRSSETAQLYLDNVKVPVKNILGEERGGFIKVTNTLFSARINQAARSLGIAQAAFDMAKDYALTRVQFGQPISKFQAIKFKLARMATEIEAARNIVYKSAWLVDNNLPYRKEASMAKLFAAETAVSVTKEAMQIHGGNGLTLEYEVQRFFRDARLSTISDGTSEIQQVIIAKELGL